MPAGLKTFDKDRSEEPPKKTRAEVKKLRDHMFRDTWRINNAESASDISISREKKVKNLTENLKKNCIIY